MSRLFAATLAAIALLAGQALAGPRSPHWEQSGSDVKADPAVRFGVLANGMRYAVMRNATPAGQVSVRLRIGSGSLEETDAEQGLAHVLEHMAFKGSTHVPEGDMLKILERAGLAFGADTNASTGWTQTVFQLDLPRPELIDTGLMLMRETGSELSIDPKALASERGVVLSEERLRDTPGYRALKAQIELLAHGQRITRRFPIGQVEVIKDAPASLVRKFYEANYRPDRATLVVVGDIDPAAVEAKIKAKFSDWRTVGPETAAPDLGRVEKRGLTVSLVQLPGGQAQILVGWARPYDPSPDSLAKRRREYVENLALEVLNRRFARLALAPKPPFIAAEAGFEDLLHSEKVAIVQASTAPDGWRPALATVDEEVRRLVKFGVSKAEIDREITRTRATLANALAGEATRPTNDLANSLVESADSDLVFTSPGEDLAIFDAAMKTITPAEVDRAARAVFAGSGPLVEVENPVPTAGGEAAVRAAYIEADAKPVIAPAAETLTDWPYASFGKPGVVKSRREIADLGVTEVTFDNGVTLSVKPTKYRQDQVLVTVDIGHGREDLPRDRPTPAWAAAALVDGGFGKLSFEDSQRVLAGHIYDANFSITDNAFELRGATRPADLATQMQVLAAYIADPGYRPEALERLRQTWLTALPQLAATPGGVLRRDFERLIHAGDPRWATPDQAELEAAKPSVLRALLSATLTSAPIEVTIIGDVTVDQAIAQTAATFGALPPRRADDPPPSDGDKTAFPTPAVSPVTLTDGGRPDQAMAVIAWPVTGFYHDMQEARATMLAGEVLQNRVEEKVRAAEGATYSPETAVALSEVFPDYGVAYAAVEIPPDKIPRFFTEVREIVEEMAAKGITADELARARNPRIATIEKAQLGNEYWQARLAGSIGDPRRLDIIRSTLPDYAKVTEADVQAATKRWLAPDTAWELVIKQGAS